MQLLLAESYGRAKALLEARRSELEVVAQGLLEYESLSGSEIVDLLGGKTVGLTDRTLAIILALLTDWCFLWAGGCAQEVAEAVSGDAEAA